MGSITALYLRTRRNIDLGVTPGTTTLNRRGDQLFRRFMNVALGQQAAAAGGDSDFTIVTTNTDPSFSNTALLMSGGAGAVGGVINGVTVTATWDTSDANSCGLVAAAINASSNALVQGFVTANNLSATLTLASVVAGTVITVCGTPFTAISGTRPENVSGQSYGNFDISGNDAADATALAAAINAMPSLSRYVSALAVSNVVRVMARQAVFTSPATFSWPTAPGTPPNTLSASAATVTLSGASLVASAAVALNACVPGVIGNAITIAASGTGVTVANTETRFQRGTGLNVVSISDRT